MDHSYEEIRAAALDVLAGREQVPYEPSQYQHISIGVAEVFARRERPVSETTGSRQPFHLSPADRELFLEVFWDLFRQGIITLGLNDSNREFPFCRLSRLGQRLVSNQDTYFFHDVSSYTKWLQQAVPSVDPVTLLYVQEALQAFRSGCILSSTVMLGVATEHTFLQVLEAAEQSPTHSKDFAPAAKERMILHKLNKFKSVLDRKFGDLTPEIREDLDTQFAGILSIIRAFRNQAGHPTGRIVDREQAYVLLQLFIPYCRKMYLLREALSK
jgi:hypothetical protein